MSAVAGTVRAALSAQPSVHSRPIRDGDRAAAGSLHGRCVVFLHAHPDDEAIFTAATMHRLVTEGARVVLVTATAGELGPALRRLRVGETLAQRRRSELERACAALGVARLVLLGFRDSGMLGWAANSHPDALARANLAGLAKGLADLCLAEGADALVHYDANGIYGHPDHVAVHRIGERAAMLAGISAYQATVDRDHLRGRGRHLVEEAVSSATAVLAAAPACRVAPVGRPSAEVTTVVVADGPALAAKRIAMAAHASQIHRSMLRRRGFAETYGREWYVRTGRVGILDRLPTTAATVPDCGRLRQTAVIGFASE
jgi:LmbE family N-acetylglucosaminyl deacetylase